MGKLNTKAMDIGLRIKDLRTKTGLSQAEFAKLVGVSASSICQVERNQTSPSLPTLLKMAEVLSVKLDFFFKKNVNEKKRIVFPDASAVEVKFPGLAEGVLSAKRLTPMDFGGTAEPYLIEISPHKSVASHFFVDKGEEMGYLLSGRLQLILKEEALYTIRPRDLIYLAFEIPTRWRNPGPGLAKLLWIKLGNDYDSRLS